MFKQKPFPFSLLILGILIALHVIGSYFSWYWVYPWFDILVHIFSGLWVGLVMLWLALSLGEINSMREYMIKSLLIAVISALLVGVVWELVENFSQVVFVNASGYAFDTILDLLNDVIGGLLAFLYFVRRRRCLDKTYNVLHPFYNQTGVIKA